MSEYIATAKVQVLPDLSRFNEQLRTDLVRKINAFNRTETGIPGVRVPAQIGTLTRQQLAAAQKSAQQAVNKTMKPVAVPMTTSPWAGTAGFHNMKMAAAAADKANANITKTGTSARAVGTNLSLMNQQAGKSRAALLGLGTASARLDSALLGLRTAIGSTAVIGLGAGALAAIALGKAIRSLFSLTVAYERELNVFQAVSGASADEMKRVAAAAKELGADITLPAVSAADAAVAMSELAKAGLSVQDAIDGARGVLQLATAANINFAQATELAASALNAFGLSGKDAVKVADTLANAANLAQGSITDIGLSLSQSAAVGRQAGLTFQDTTAFLTLLAQAGLKGSDAGTSLRTALIRLINPTAKAAAIIEDLGVSIRDNAGNIRPDIFIQFSNAMRDLTPEARDAQLAIIGGQDALRAFAILGRASTKDFLALRAELRQQGTAAEVAAARTKGLGGAMQALQSTLETVGITIGQKIAPGTTELVNNLTASVNVMAESQGVASIFAASLSAVGIAMNAVGAAAASAAPLLLSFTNALGTTVSTIGVEQILAFALAFKVLRAAQVAFFAPAFTSATGLAGAFRILGFRARWAFDSIRALFALFATGAGIMGGLRVGLAGIAAALTGPVGIAIGVAAATAGIVYLITRESEAEKATRQFKEATDALAQSLGNAKAAAEGAANAQRTAGSSRLGVAQAKLAQEQAAAALASSRAAKGSIERRQLEINLAVAIQNVTFATRDYAEAIRGLNEAQEANRAAQIAVKDAQKAEVAAIEGLIAATEKQVELEQRRPKKSGISFTDLELEARGREKLIATLRKQAAQEKTSDDAAVRAGAKRKQLLADLIATTKKFPDKVTVDIIVKEKITNVVANLTKQWRDAGFTSAETYKRYLLAGLGIAKDEVSAYLRGPFADAATRASVDAMKGAGKAASEAFAGALDFSEALAAAEARGESPQQQLARALKEQQAATAAFTKLDVATKGGTQFKSQAQEDAYNLAVERKRTADAAVERLTGQIKSDAQAQQQKIEDAANARDKAAQALFELLTSTGKGIRALNTKLEDAGVTPTLTDDIKFTKILLATYRKIQKNLARRLKELGASASVIRELTRAISDLVNDTARDLKKLQQDQADAIKAANEAAQNALMAKFDAQIRFFEVKGDIQGEIKARTARLKAITAQLAKLKNAGKRYTAAWWDLKAQQAEEIAAIKELKGQTKEKNKAQAALMFAFLQAQQGFAANLLGNLIGGGMTGGLVGNTSPTAPAGQKGGLPSWLGQKDPGTMTEAINSGLVEQGQISAGMKLGVSRGQGTTQTELLRQILRTLDDIKRGSGFPGAKYQKARVSSSMDTGGGSGGAAVVA